MFLIVLYGKSRVGLSWWKSPVRSCCFNIDPLLCPPGSAGSPVLGFPQQCGAPPVLFPLLSSSVSPVIESSPGQEAPRLWGVLLLLGTETYTLVYVRSCNP